MDKIILNDGTEIFFSEMNGIEYAVVENMTFDELEEKVKKNDNLKHIQIANKSFTYGIYDNVYLISISKYYSRYSDSNKLVLSLGETTE